MDNTNTSAIAQALISINDILSKQPTGSVSDIFKIVGSSYGLTTISDSTNVAIIRKNRIFSGLNSPKKEGGQKPLVSKQPLYLPNGQPSAAHPLAQRAPNGRLVGLHSFRGPKGQELSFQNEWESESEEEEKISPYGSDGDDSVNRVGY
jgi:hypothetical protein